MKTTEDKVNGIAKWTNQGMRQAVIDLLKDDRNEIKQVIDEMIEKYREKQQRGVNYPETVTSLEMIGWHNKIEALTELKSKI